MNSQNDGREEAAMKSPVNGAETILQFIEQNSDKMSITIVRNGQKLASHAEDRMMPLASTVKIIIAIEYARQAATGRLDPAQPVALEELDCFYVPNLDGGAHPAWVQQMTDEGAAEDGWVTMQDVAKGMMDFSSNANTEFLMHEMGLENINALLQELNLASHEPLFPFVSALFIPYELIEKGKKQGLGHSEAIECAKRQLRSMNDEEFRQIAGVIHHKLAGDTDGSYQKRADILSWYDETFDRMFTDRFISSTTANYASLLGKLNSRRYFSEEEQTHLSHTLEGLMESTANREWLRHAGRKGGSTAYTLSEAIYVTDLQGHTTEMALFFRDLTPVTQAQLEESINNFELRLLTDEGFRKEAAARIGGGK
jgi:D-alanyl-D-alanine carboxypeptidase